MGEDLPFDRRTLIVRAVILVLAAVVVALAIFADRWFGGDPGFGRGQQLLAAAGLALAASSFLPVLWSERVIVLVASTALGIVLTEAALRVAVGPRFASIYQLDARCLHRHIPSSNKIYRRTDLNGGQKILVRINSQGYRGEELRERSAGSRVVLYGDSFIAAEFSAEEATVAGRLHTGLTSAVGAPVEVVNAGVSGYGPDQIEARLEEELPELKPDLVIVFIYAGNDFGDLMRDKMFKLDENGELQRTSFVLDGALVAQFEEARKRFILLKILDHVRFGGEDHFTPQADIARWLRTASAEYEAYVIRGDDTVSDLLADHPDVDLSTDPESPASRYKARLMEQVLVRIQGVCQRAATPLLFVFIPSPIDVCDRCDVQHVDSVRFPDYRRSNNTDILQRIAVDHQMPFINLFSPFRDAGPEKLYFRRDDHWNDEGQALAAQEVQDYILTHGLLRTAR